MSHTWRSAVMKRPRHFLAFSSELKSYPSLEYMAMLGINRSIQSIPPDASLYFFVNYLITNFGSCDKIWNCSIVGIDIQWMNEWWPILFWRPRPYYQYNNERFWTVYALRCFVSKLRCLLKKNNNKYETIIMAVWLLQCIADEGLIIMWDHQYKWDAIFNGIDGDYDETTMTTI